MRRQAYILRSPSLDGLSPATRMPSYPVELEGSRGYCLLLGVGPEIDQSRMQAR